MSSPVHRGHLALAGLAGFLAVSMLAVIVWAVVSSIGGEPAAAPSSATISATTTADLTSRPPSTTTTRPVAAVSLTATTACATEDSIATTTTVLMSKEVQVICREAWGALPSAGEFTFHEIDHITIHHTGALIEDNRLSPGFTRRHQRYHMGSELGWPDIAYHFLVDSHGFVYEGRRWDAVGDTRTSYDPTGHLLIAAKGNFNEQTITDAQYESLVDMLAWGAQRFGIDPEDIQGHRDLAATACPGDTLYPLIADGTIALDVRTVLDNGGANLVYICGPEAEQLVADIESGNM